MVFLFESLASIFVFGARLQIGFRHKLVSGMGWFGCVARVFAVVVVMDVDDGAGFARTR
jgi:hypothetical protein